MSREVPPPTPPEPKPMHDEEADLEARLGEVTVAANELAFALTAWCELHHWQAAGEIIARSRRALERWDALK